MDQSADLSPNKQALLKIRELKQQLSEAQRDFGGPVAIVSMACRFPRRSRTPELFWQCLMEQSDEVSEIPEDRWDLDAFYDEDPEVPGKMYARKGVFLDHLDLMDPEFFGISPREATWIDPQQRLLMEVGWEALERAGWPVDQIGEHTGVFVGWMHNDYQNEASDSFLNLNPYIATGAAGSFLPGRLAYYLGLQGPSLAVDTACSSSLVALHLACQSLQRGDCDRALVGGVNAIVSPTTNILTCKLKALSPNGHSRAFDASADGYLRGEGCGVVTLRRLEDAERDGDPITGIIRGSAMGHNGFSSGLTAPNPKAQEKVIRQALERANVSPDEVGYLEAHGTGTELGDPIELQAASAALAGNRTDDNRLLVGSVKTNIGHLEAAAGMAGLIKVLLAMQHDKIPGQLNFENPNPHIPWDQLPVKIVTEPTDWPSISGRRFAGVSAFGMSGTNAHVVIEAPKPKVATKKTRHEVRNEFECNPARPLLIVLSGKLDEAVQNLAEDIGQTLSTNPSVDIADVGFTLGVGRSHFEHRAALVATNREDAIRSLRSISRGADSETTYSGYRRRAPKIAWQFTGQGAQYVEMGRQLYESQPVFREAIEHCDELLTRWRNHSLLSVLFGGVDNRASIDDTTWTQPAIFSIQMGLVRLLNSWGLQADAVLGHSVGQYAAACTANMMSWDDGLKLISERGRLIGELPASGSMMAVFAPPAEVEKAIASTTEVAVAAFNGTHVVISGDDSAVQLIGQQLADRGIRTKALTTSHAFHSALMDPVLDPFKATANEVTFRSAEIPLVCNVTGKVLPADAVLDGEYWARHIREPVRYSDAVTAVQELGYEVLLELGPQSVLTRMAAATWKPLANFHNGLISCLERDADDSMSILKAVGQLYTLGADIDFDQLYAGSKRQRIVLPTYPFQRRRFWGPDKPRAFHAEYHTAHPLLGSKVALAGLVDQTRYESFVDVDSPSWLPDHEVMGHVVLPGAAFVEMAIAAAGSSDLANLAFEQPLRPTTRTALQTVVRNDADQTTIESYSANLSTAHAEWTRHFTAQIIPSDGDRPSSVDFENLIARCDRQVSPDDFYKKMAELGLTYGPSFQTVQSLKYSNTEVVACLKTLGDIRGFTIPPTLLDGALHSLAVGLVEGDEEHLFLPVGIGRVSCFQSIENEVWCHAIWNDNSGSLRTADLTLFTEQGDVVATIQSLRVQQVSRSALRQMSGAGPDRLLYEIAWQKTRLPASTTKSTNWLLVQTDCSQSTVAQSIAATLEARQHKCLIIDAASETEIYNRAGKTISICAANPENWTRLLEELPNELGQFPDGVVWLTSTTTNLNCSGILNLAHGLQAKNIRQLECGLQFITTDAIAVADDSNVEPHQTKYWGLGRVLAAEQPMLRCRMIDIPSSTADATDPIDLVVDILLTKTQDHQFVVRDEQLLVPRLKQASTKRRAQSELPIDPEGCYLITGGLGMLGRLAAKWLAENGAQQVVLVSRRSPDEKTQEFLNTIAGLGCDAIVHSANAGSRDDVEKLFARFGSDLNPLSGVIHAAGVLDDALIGEQTWERFGEVLAPKVDGAQLLHEFTASMSLDFFVLYSSAASVLGSPGQSNYATANAYLDGLAWHRRSLGLPALSINWGPWTEGMADDERIAKRLALQGITPLGVSEAHDAMQKMLTSSHVQTTVIDVDWRRMNLGLGADSPTLLEELIPARQKSQVGDSEFVGKLKRLKGSAQKEMLVQVVQKSLQQILSTPELPEIDRPLIELGLDSLLAVEFGTELQQLLGDQLAVGPTMLFDHPTIDAIADHVLELLSESEGNDPPKQDQPARIEVGTKQTTRDDVAIIGMSCRFPGARDVNEFWDNLMNGVDSVGEIPDDRWDIDRFYSAEREPGKMYSREGGFLEDIGDFDAAFFTISDQEACWIDPQHRMLLENSYRALEDAGIATDRLADSNVGVFMGIMGQDYAFLPHLDDTEIIKAFEGAGLSHSAGVGRISYVFGFEGPSIAVDTASSSSLVALIQAVRSLQDGNCNMALAGGVNAILAPVNSLLMSKANLLAPDGRCKSFSAQADGFGRGEGCGVVVLKRLSDAKRDGDRIMAVVRGGSIVHNGFSGGITSPSGKSQSRAIGDALNDAGMTPAQVQYLEAHGTGTEFGDPMELGAAAAVYGKGRKPDEPLLVGSVKANISHLEAAGGVSGLIKTVLSLRHGVIPPQLHFEEPSPHIPWKRMPIKIVTESTPWPEAKERVAGITALGLVGTNAHVILSSPATNETNVHPSEADDFPDRTNNVLPISARSEEALCELARRYHQFLSSDADADLADVCYTAGRGRRHYEYRAAISVESREDATRKLAALTRSSPALSERNGRNGNEHRVDDTHAEPTFDGLRERGIYIGEVNSPPKITWFFNEFEPDATLTEHSKSLFRAEPVFRETLEQIDDRLSQHISDTSGHPRDGLLLSWLQQTPNDDSAVSRELKLFAFQAGLAKLWESWGIEPDLVIGRGVGQFTASSIAGGLCIMDAATLIYERQKVVKIRDAAPSGETNDLSAEVNVALDQFESFADSLNYYPPNLPLVCSLSGEIVPVHRSLGGSYWRRHCIETPISRESLFELAAETDCLIVMGNVSNDVDSSDRFVSIESTVPNRNASSSMTNGLARLYSLGARIDFAGLNHHWKRSKVGLPTYPFQKKRYWITEIDQHTAEPTESLVR